MIAMMLLVQAAMPPQPRMQCTPALVARATPSGWATPGSVRDGGVLAIGRGATVALVPGARFAVPPGKPPAAGSRGASVGFAVPRRGRWHVLLGEGAWIDVVRDGRVVESAAHGHGVPCSGVRKRVDYDLAPGRYVLQLSGATVGEVRVMVSRG